MAVLMALLNRLTLSSGAALLKYLGNIDWSSIDYDTRLTALHELHAAIIKVREAHNLAPFDDSRENNVFRRAHVLLLSSPAHAGDRPECGDGQFAEQQLETQKAYENE